MFYIQLHIMKIKSPNNIEINIALITYAILAHRQTECITINQIYFFTNHELYHKY